MARSNQQSTPTEEQAATEAKPTAREAFDKLTVPEDPAQAFVHTSISDACDLIDAKAELQHRVQQSRDFLDYAVKSEQTSEEQAAWIAAYLPKRTRVTRTDNGASAESGAEASTEE